VVVAIGFRGLAIPLGQRILGIIFGIRMILFLNCHFDNGTNQIIAVTINANEN